MRGAALAFATCCGVIVSAVLGGSLADAGFSSAVATVVGAAGGMVTILMLARRKA